MRILHFLPATEKSVDFTNLYLSTLVGFMQKKTEVMVIRSDGGSISDYRKQAKAFNPHILHIHTCWELPSAKMAKWAHSSNIPVVLSPHGMLEPWIVEKKYLHEKLPKLLLYQHETICNADAIVVTGEMEQRSMETLSWNEHIKSKRPWNERLCLVKNAVITNAISDEQMTDEILRLYRKVLDSNAWMLMTPDDRLAEDGLLRAGLARTPASNTLTEEQRNLIGHLNEESWRRILIHADEEDVLPIVRRGAALIDRNASSAESMGDFNAQPPSIDVEAVDRFAPRCPKSRGPIETSELNDSSMKQKFKELEQEYGENAELDMCRMTANLRQETRKGTLSRRHLAETYERLRYEDFDEERLARMLRQAELDDFTVKLQQTLSQMLGLTEGFMIYS